MPSMQGHRQMARAALHAVERVQAPLSSRRGLPYLPASDPVSRKADLLRLSEASAYHIDEAIGRSCRSRERRQYVSFGRLPMLGADKIAELRKYRLPARLPKKSWPSAPRRVWPANQES